MKKAVCSLFLFLVVSAVVYGVAGHKQFLLWEDQTGHGSENFARSVVVAGSKAIVAEKSLADVSVTAYDVGTGTVRWQGTLPTPPSGIGTGYLAESQGSTFLACNACNITDGIFVRSYSIETGDVLWTNVVPGAGAQAIAAGGDHVTIGGITTIPTLNGPRPVGLVRTYDAATGEILWESRIDKNPVDFYVWAVAASRRFVVVAGTTIVREEGSRRDLFLRAYAAKTGRLLWEAGQRAISPTSIAIDRDQVFVAGIDFTAEARSKTFLAAFDINTGVTNWQSPGFEGHLQSVATNRSQLIAVGNVSNPTTSAFVESIDSRTGQVLWSDQTSQPGFSESFVRVAIDERAVYAVGSAGKDPGIYSETLLRAYSLDGKLLIDERSHGSRSSFFLDVSLKRKRLVAVGSVENEATRTRDGLVRAYDVTAIVQSRR